MADNRDPWYTAEPYNDEQLLTRTVGCFRQASGWRSRRIEDISAMAWAYERDRWLASNNAVGHKVPENVQRAMPWLSGDASVPPSVNIMKAAVDTVVNWLMVENPAMEVKALGASYEQRRQTELRSHALDSLFNMPEYAQQHRKVGRDGLSKGIGAAVPRVRNGRVIFQRLHYAQTYWDPYDARDGEPTMVGVVEYVDRGHLLGWYRKLTGVKNQDERRKALERCKSEVWGRNPIMGMDGYQWIGPYDAELQSTQVSEGTDRVCLVHWWRTASAFDANDGRYTLMVIGSDCGPGPGRVLVDHTFTRCTLPVVAWTPYPADEGIDGIGLQHQLKPWQEAIDRSFFKLQRVLDKYGHVKAFFPPGTIKNKEEFLAAGVTVIETDALAEPKFVNPIDLSPADLQWIDRCLSWSRNEYGINQMLASGGTALGANAPAVAMVEEQYRSLDRLSDIESNWQNFRMALARETLHAIDDARKLDPSFAAHFFDQNQDLQVKPWAELIQPNERYTCALEPTGALGKTRAGRISKIMDLAQRGMVDPALAKDALLSSPDIRRMARLETAAMRLVEAQLAQIIDPDGDHANAMPSEGDPLALQIDLADRYIYDARASGAEQDTIERLREYRRTAEAVQQSQMAKAQPPAMAMPPGPEAGVPANVVDMSSPPV